ncbi:efflux RND transporter periplasmic adaptor subunit [Anaeromyxobacter terrae]|uniref:efflux RND transporter periplasmic adaptor subunit n=1 Tax=Anaeromyxobacter terrae TaxID=2925406 RepID=UPI001F58A3F4|nr:efflux RND transporter periplasmic adaptor subunit [Anaeromyxobacter sp. SG22]
MKRSAFLYAVVAVVSAAAGLGLGALVLRRPAGAPMTSASGERKALYYRDPMNPSRTSPVPRKDEMGMDYVPVYEGGDGAGAAAPGGVYVDPRMAQNSGVRVEEVRVRRMSKVIRTVGQVTYDERRLQNVNAKVMGWIDRLYVDFTGKPVRRGDPLMAIYSPTLFSTQQDYLLAIRNRSALARDTPLRAEADALVDAARQRLLYFDIPESDIGKLERRGAPTKTLTVRSPVDGYVVEKSVVQGAQVTPGMPLLKIADLSSVWVLADIYEYELPWVATGQQATMELPYAPGTTLEGRVAYVYPYLAGETRTVKVRIEVRNPGGRIQLKPDMYATVTIRSPIVRETVAVPEQAVIRTGERSVGIVALGGGWFEPRDLKLGVTADGYAEVLAGLEAGEQLVTSSQFLIDSESNLRSAVAGMGAHEGMQGAGGSTSPRTDSAPAAGRGGAHAGHEVEGRKPPDRSAEHDAHEGK